jgi:hypothetical protein
MNISDIHNMVSSQNLGFFSPRYIAWLTLRSPLFWSILSSIFIVARSCFDRRLFFVTTPRRDSATAAAVSETRRRLPTCYSRSATDWIGVTIVDRDRFGSCRPPPPALYSASIGLVLLYTGPARLSLLQLARRFSFGPEPRGHAAPLELPCVGRRVLEHRGHVSAPELPGGGNRSRGDTRRPQSCPAPGGGCCPRSCPEPVYCWLFLVFSS